MCVGQGRSRRFPINAKKSSSANGDRLNPGLRRLPAFAHSGVDGECLRDPCEAEASFAGFLGGHPAGDVRTTGRPIDYALFALPRSLQIGT
jgi:hypothetical protein